MIEIFLLKTLPDLKKNFEEFNKKEGFKRDQFAALIYKNPPPKVYPNCHLFSSKEAVSWDGVIAATVLFKRKRHAESAVVIKAKEIVEVKQSHLLLLYTYYSPCITCATNIIILLTSSSACQRFILIFEKYYDKKKALKHGELLNFLSRQGWSTAEYFEYSTVEYFENRTAEYFEYNTYHCMIYTKKKSRLE